MSNIRVNAFPSRKQYTYAGGVPVFVVDFPFFDNGDLFVYLSDPADNFDQEDPLNILVYGVDYAVTGAGLNTGGTVTLTVNPTIGFTVTIVGRMPIDRFSIYEDSSVVSMAQLNEDFNRLVVMVKNIDTIIEQTMPKYDRSEYVQITRSNPNTPFSYVNLPMLETNETWVGNATNTGLTKLFIGGAGTGNVISTGNPMRQSIANWTGNGTQITDTNLNIVGDFIIPTAGVAANLQTGFGDTWGAMHWPAHVTANRPVAPVDGDTYYDTNLNQFFGYENGAWVAFSTGGGTDGSIIKVIAQPGHNLVEGDHVYVDAAGLYQKTLSTIPLTAEEAGMVISVNPDTIHFTLQVVGFIDGVAFNVTPPGPLTPGGIYFLSDTVLGAMTLNEPVINGEVSLPVFIAETATGGQLRQSRGFIIGGEPAPDGGGAVVDTSTETINDVTHTFVKGNWIYSTGDDTYALGDATAFASSQVEWVVIDIVPAVSFTIQQSGKITNVVTVDDIGGAIASGTICYLSTTNPGFLTQIAPAGLGTFTKPLYVQTDLASKHGWILEQRPLPVTAPSAPGGDQLIQTFTLNNGDTFLDFGANLLDGTYTDIRIVGRGITVADGTGNSAANALKMQVYTNGILRTGAATYRNFGQANKTNAHLLTTAFGVLAATFGTVAGGSFEFDARIKNAPSTTLYKNVYQTNIAVQSATVSPATGNPPSVNISDIAHGGGGPNATENDSWIYVGDTLNLTGFYLFLDYPVGANTAFFTGGTISVYGTVA
jgi:hypothetical protein